MTVQVSLIERSIYRHVHVHIHFEKLFDFLVSLSLSSLTKTMTRHNSLQFFFFFIQNPLTLHIYILYVKRYFISASNSVNEIETRQNISELSSSSIASSSYSPSTQTKCAHVIVNARRTKTVNNTIPKPKKGKKYKNKRNTNTHSRITLYSCTYCVCLVISFQRNFDLMHFRSRKYVCEGKNWKSFCCSVSHKSSAHQPKPMKST